jgi:hypothetical protein
MQVTLNDLRGKFSRPSVEYRSIFHTVLGVE